MRMSRPLEDHVHIVRSVTLSFGNIMLIARQKPDATNVAGLRTWNSLGRFVKRGEKGIFILALMVGKKRKEEETTAGAPWWSTSSHQPGWLGGNAP
jgi:N-terminal domain of anti-restriction factor ArdC